MFVLSGVFNTRILDAANYANQDYMHVNYTTYSCLHYALSNRQPIKKHPMFLPGYGPIEIADGQSLYNAIYWSNMGFSVYWCSH
jgi:hypothetical protein